MVCLKISSCSWCLRSFELHLLTSVGEKLCLKINFFFVSLQPDFGSWAPLKGLRDHADWANAHSAGLLWTSRYLDNIKFSRWRLLEHKVQRSNPHGVHSPSIALAC